MPLLNSKWSSVALAGLLLAMTPDAAMARTITVGIGSFSWEEFLGVEFSLQNDSALGGVAGDFVDLSLVLTPDADLDGDGAVDAPFEAFPTTLLSGSDQNQNSFTITFDGPFSSAQLRFRFVPTGLPELVFEDTFAGLDERIIEYSYEVEDPPAAVPEPATWLLLGCGLGAAVASRRRR